MLLSRQRLRQQQFCVGFVIAKLLATFLVGGFVVDFYSALLTAQETVQIELRSDLTLEDVLSSEKETKEASQLSDAIKNSALPMYAAAREFLLAEQAALADCDRFQTMAQQAPDLLKTAEIELNFLSSEQTPQTSRKQSEAQLQELLRQKNLELVEARGYANFADHEPARRQTKLLAIPNFLNQSQARLGLVSKLLTADLPSDESPYLSRAKWSVLRAEHQCLESQIAAAQAEQIAYTATIELPPLQSQIAQQKLKRLESTIEDLKSNVIRLRESEIQKRIRQAAEELRNAPEILKQLAQQNLDLAQQLESTSQRIANVTRDEEQIESVRLMLEKKFETTQGRVDVIGLNDTLGIMLRQNKTEIEKLRIKHRLDNRLREEVNDIRANSFRSEDQAELLSDLESATSLAMANLEIPIEAKEQFRNSIEQLLANQHETLIRLASMQNDLFDALYGMQYEQGLFSEVCSDYTSYIDQHVLWICSAKVISGTDLVETAETIRSLSLPEHWPPVWKSLTISASQRPYMVMSIGLGLLLLFLFQTRLRTNIRSSASITSVRSCREYNPTATTLLETILLTSFWPGVLLTLGWLLRADILASQLTHALGGGLIALGLAIAPLEFMRQVCRDHGLAQSHFDWPNPSRNRIRNSLGGLILFGSPLLLIVATMARVRNETWNNSLGRLSMIILLSISLATVIRILRPRGPIFMAHVNRKSNFYRLRYLLFFILVSGHVALIAFALAGYYYTSYQLSANLLHSIIAAIILVVLFALSLRFLLVRRRRLRYDQLVQQRDQQIEQLRLADEEPLEKTLPPAAIAKSLDIELKTEHENDIVSVTQQARDLTGLIFVVAAIVCVWQIWQDVLPATKLLDDKAVWVVTIGDTAETEIVSRLDVMMSLGLFLLMFLSVRNIPGMLELLLLKRLPLDAGSRYAITTIFRYVITVVGIILALNLLKISWEKYSWLVAAISVGLGFGLQEIVANFVSGLIILLERPVRVGDVVTIDNTTGIVSRIQMRATTVTNWDNQELVVPNKDLVTEKLMNWTLSSVVNRLSIQFGVAYGSDAKQVHDLIMKVALSNEHVLADPKPIVSLDAFGDSSLNFTLRCCVTAIEKRFVITHQINTDIYDALNETGIVIPFPQRDIHIIQDQSGDAPSG